VRLGKQLILSATTSAASDVHPTRATRRRYLVPLTGRNYESIDHLSHAFSFGQVVVGVVWRRQLGRLMSYVVTATLDRHSRLSYRVND